MRLRISFLTFVMLLVCIVMAQAQTLPMYGPGTSPPPAKVWASVAGGEWSGEIVFAAIGQEVSFKATTPLGAALPSVDTDAVNGVNTDQGPGSIICAWDVGSGVADKTVTVNTVVTETYDTAGTYLVSCATDDTTGTLYDDAPSWATLPVTVVILTADQKAALEKIDLAVTVLYRQGKLAEAKALLESLLGADLPPDVRAQLYAGLAMIAVANGDFDAARALYLKMTTCGACERLVVAGTSMAADCLMMKGDWAGAIAAYQSLVRMYPKYREYCGGAAYHIGWSLRRSGQLAEALTQARKGATEYADTTHAVLMEEEGIITARIISATEGTR